MEQNNHYLDYSSCSHSVRYSRNSVEKVVDSSVRVEEPNSFALVHTLEGLEVEVVAEHNSVEAVAEHNSVEAVDSLARN